LKFPAAGVGSSPGEDENPFAAVRCPGLSGGYNDPFRIETEVGQVSENGSDCPNKSSLMPLAASHRPLAESHDASGPGQAASCTIRVPLRDRDAVLVFQPSQET